MSSKDLHLLCERCKGIVNLVWLPHCSEYTHLTVQALKASAAVGCSSCRLISRTIGNIAQAITPPGTTDIYRLREEEPTTEWSEIFATQELRFPPETRPSKLVGRARSGRFIYQVFDYPKPKEDFQTEFEIFVPC
jgi:hypothetical protein